MDVCWSPDDRLLASASLDNSVFVWDMQGKQRATLLGAPALRRRARLVFLSLPPRAGHESFVKGVAWDPVGTYLASQGDDKSVHVWRCEDWSRVAVIRQPFLRTVGNSTFSLRLCWSPDGRTLTATNSTNNGQRTAAVLDRETWKARAPPARATLACSPAHPPPVLQLRGGPQAAHRGGALQQPPLPAAAGGRQGGQEGRRAVLLRRRGQPGLHGAPAAARARRASRARRSRCGSPRGRSRWWC